MKPVFSVSLPEYTLDKQPNYNVVGGRIDEVIKEQFKNYRIALRYLSLQDHQSLTADELINIINRTGTDKYDPERKMSVAHDFYSEKGVEMFAVPIPKFSDLDSMGVIKDFYEGALVDRGYSLRIDLVVVYDLDQLESIPIQYDDGVGEDAFKFKYPENKADAVLGFVKVT